MSTVADGRGSVPSLSRVASDDGSFEMDNSTTSLGSSRQEQKPNPNQDTNIAGVARHTLGLILLLFVVFFWTASNFLGSNIFADNTYAKPFFLTYLNTSMFLLTMIPLFVRSGFQMYRDGNLFSNIRQFSARRTFKAIYSENPEETEAFINPDDLDDLPQLKSTRSRTHLGLKPTARLSLAFCILWFSANYFAMACLRYTTVASATILTSTSSIWTLLLGSITRTEKFTWRKLCGVFGSLIGIVLISHTDLSPSTPHEPRARAIDTFPDKSPAELALGDALALFSAVIYGFYTIALKHTTVKAAPLQLNMPLFFGLVGFFNAILLWPLFLILSWTGQEKFEFPPTQRVWTILLINGTASLLSDICWAYAMVLTSPLVITVGLSLSIPLSLVGEMIIQGRTEGLIYWIGAAIVVCSFVFVDREEVKEEGQGQLAVPVMEDPGQQTVPGSEMEDEDMSDELPR